MKIDGQSKTQRWAGYLLSGLPVLFLLLDALGKFVKPEPVVTGTTELGYSENIIIPLGIVLLISTLLYILPKTSVLGAILLTGYLGGAVATHVRVESPLFSHVLVPVYFGILLWLGLYFREDRLKSLMPFHDKNPV